MLVYGINFADSEGKTNGHQLLGVALFWVPRDLWPNKPLPTGPLLGGSFINIMVQTANTNLSAPAMLEGYLDFGYFGVLFVAAIIGLACGAFDTAILARRETIKVADPGHVVRIDAIAAPLIGLWMFFMRGSLMPTFAFTFGILTGSLFVWEIFFRSSPILFFMPKSVRLDMVKR